MHISLKKRTLLLLLLLFFGNFINYSYGYNINYNRPYIVVNAKTGDVLAENESFQPWYPASLTKMMTTYLTFKAMAEKRLNVSSKVTLTRFDVSQAPSKSGYPSGTILSLENALKIMLVKSTNDVASAIGRLIGKTNSNFVFMMNQQAKILAMNNTHFTSANGLPNPNNYSTARDLALLALALRHDFPQYAKYFNIKYLKLGGQSKTILNSNNLLGHFPGIDGMKTGFICASGYNLVASAKRDNNLFIAVILGAPRLDIREEVAALLLENAFDSSPTANIGNIYDMRLPGYYNKLPPDLHKEMCTIEAVKKRRPYLTKDFRPILNSPYISDDCDNTNIISVMPLYIPPKHIIKIKHKYRKQSA